MYGPKVMMRDTFHGDPRPSLWISRTEASLIVPQGSETNE